MYLLTADHPAALHTWNFVFSRLMLSFADGMNTLYISSTDKNKYFDLEFGDLHLMELKVHPGDTNSIQSDVSENPEQSQSVESDPTDGRKTPSRPVDTSKTALVIPVLFFRQTSSPYKIQKRQQMNRIHLLT